MCHDDVRRALRLLATHLELVGGEGTGEVLSRLAEQDVTVTQPVAPGAKPVLRHLPDMLRAMAPTFAELSSLLSIISDRLCWSQSSSYTDEILGKGFTDNYAWAELIGPKGVIPGDDFTLGFLLLGPGRHYRDHYHPAPELYVPLTAGSLWKKADGPFIARQQGEAIWHPSMMLHATKTFAEPLIAAYCWTRDVETPARLKSD